MSINKTSDTLVIAGRGTSSHDTRAFQQALKPNPDIWSINGLQPYDWSTEGERYGVDLHEPQHMKNSVFYGLAVTHRFQTSARHIIRRCRLDVDGIVKHFDCGFLANTLVILMAKAHMMGYNTIVLPGIDTFAFEHDPVAQEASFAFWLGYMKEAGVKFVTSATICRNQSDLNRSSFAFGKEMFLAESGHRSQQLLTFLEINENIYK